jgi:cobalt-precorrin-5B (C1)-methyltransferase
VTGPELREPDLPRTAKQRGRALRTGWTTGTCAAAAAKAAATALRTGEVQRDVEIALPSGRRVGFPVDSCELVPRRAEPAAPAVLPPPGRGERAEGAGAAQPAEGAGGTASLPPVRAEAVVVKDAGDDPDVTHGAHLTATVTWREAPGIELDGGVGVGVVTSPGLGLELGAPAINPVPREMITQAVGEAVDLASFGIRVVISVPGGERMARKTTNARLGIIGGISILGTTGIVRPFSTASWRASVEQAVSVLAARGETTAVLCTGGRTEKAAMALLPGLPEVCFIEVGDFTGAALRRLVACGVGRVVFAGMAGKLAKLAGGVLMTHYTRSRVPHDLLAEITRAAGGAADLAAQVEAANSARHAAELWDEAGLLPAAGTELCRRVAEVLARFCAEAAAAPPAPAPPAPPAPAPPGPALAGSPAEAPGPADAPSADTPPAPVPAGSAAGGLAPVGAPTGDRPPAPTPAGSAAGGPVPVSVRVIMVDFSGRAQLAAYPPAYLPGTPA